MQTLKLISVHNPATAEFVGRVADRVIADIGSKRTPARPKAVILWGGGKDSTLALALLTAVSELAPLDIITVTMDNPGMSQGTLVNIETISRNLGLEHQFWHFHQRVSAPHTADSDWRDLYTRLYRALNGSPRFMCVACNLCSIVTEYSSIEYNVANYLVTGNAAWELVMFANWVSEIKTTCSTLDFPEPSGNALLDYYRIWHLVYEKLLLELFSESRESASGMLKTYLYDSPTDSSVSSSVQQLNLLGDNMIECTAIQHQELLRELGWQLPKDILGSTESDCAMPSVIAHLNIVRHGLPKHVLDLREAAVHFRPLPEMISRAEQWALSGQVHLESEQLLKQIGFALDPLTANAPPSPIAKLLLNQLFKIR